MKFLITDIEGTLHGIDAVEYDMPSGEFPFAHIRFYDTSSFMDRMRDSGIEQRIPVYSIAVHRVASIEVEPNAGVP